MSIISKQIQEILIEPVSSIHDESMKQVDFETMLEYINVFINVKEMLQNKDEKVFNVWNEIVGDSIACMYNAMSGFYHIANIGLRSILEMACSAFYYYDHKIEHYLYMEQNAKADKYVNTLIDNFDFYKTNYIKAFYPQINNNEKEVDSVSKYLKRLYSKLCDIVHGRFYTLSKTDELKIEFNIAQFNYFQDNFKDVISILILLFVLRFNDLATQQMIEKAQQIGVVDFE